MDCNIQVRNFQFSSVTCRLCLSENLSAPYTDLSEDIVKAEDIRDGSQPRTTVTVGKPPPDWGPANPSGPSDIPSRGGAC